MDRDLFWSTRGSSGRMEKEYREQRSRRRSVCERTDVRILDFTTLSRC